MSDVNSWAGWWTCLDEAVKALLNTCWAGTVARFVKARRSAETAKPSKSVFTHAADDEPKRTCPHLLEDIRSIAEPSGQTDPTFLSTRIYAPLSAEELRLRLISQRGYQDAQLPSTLRRKLIQRRQADTPARQTDVDSERQYLGQKRAVA